MYIPFVWLSVAIRVSTYNVDGHIKYLGIIGVGENGIERQVIMSFNTTTHLGSNRTWIYFDHQSRLIEATGTREDTSELSLSPYVSSISIIHDRRSSALLYLGSLPDSMRPYVFKIGETALSMPPTDLLAVSVSNKSHTVTGYISLMAWNHSMCGEWFISDIPSVSATGSCTNESPVVFSLR
jgi:hypothetical protein